MPDDLDSRPYIMVDGKPVKADLRLAHVEQRHRLQARHVLNDAYVALGLLEAQHDLTVARIHYFSLVALLRAVGHVLDKVDGASSDDVKRASRRKYDDLRKNPEENEVFFYFIEAERNLILKEYRSKAEMVVPVGVLIDLNGNEMMHEGLQPFPMFIFDDGPFAGEDARDVAPRAIAFWDEYLGAIELECFGESYQQDFEPIKEGVTLPKNA